jgi:hypothetical protein
MSTEWTPTAIAIGSGELYRGRFEYRVERRPRSTEHDGFTMTGEELKNWLNGLGAQGWQLCAVREDEYGASELFFKRELP